MGETVDVLFESSKYKGYMHGFSENYIKVKTKCNPEYVNKIVSVNLRKIDKDGLYVHQ